MRHRAQGVIAVYHKTGQQVVLVGGQNQAADLVGQHAAGHKAGENIAEIAGGHRKIDLVHPNACGNLERGMDIVDDLGHDPGPVDGIDRAQLVLFLELQIVEDGLDDGLPVVKGAAHRQIEDIGIGHRGHLQFLDGADPLVGVEDEDVDPLLAPHPVDRGAAGIAGGGAEDVHFAAGFLEQVLKDIAQKLQGHVLEGQGRPVEQLQDVTVALLDQRGDLRVVEGAVRSFDQLAQVVWRDIIDKEAEHGCCQLRIAELAPLAQGFVGDLRDRGGQQQAAVGGKAHHHGLLEGYGGNAAPGADVLHKRLPFDRLITARICCELMLRQAQHERSIRLRNIRSP